VREFFEVSVMLGKKNTLSDKEAIYIVTVVAMMSLKNLYDNGTYLSSVQRSASFNLIKQQIRGDCSTWHASKLMSYADTLAKYIELSYETMDVNDSNLARAEVCRIGIEGLRDRGLLNGELWHLYRKNLSDFTNEQIRDAINEEIFDTPQASNSEPIDIEPEIDADDEETDLEVRLEKLSRLYKSKLITKKVYEEKQAEILAEL
jgi:hypothetical protein